MGDGTVRLSILPLGKSSVRFENAVLEGKWKWKSCNFSDERYAYLAEGALIWQTKRETKRLQVKFARISGFPLLERSCRQFAITGRCKGNLYELRLRGNKLTCVGKHKHRQ